MKGPVLKEDSLLPEKLRPEKLRYNKNHTNRQPAQQIENTRLENKQSPLFSASPKKNSFAQELERMIQKESVQAGVSSDLIRAIVKTESNGNPNALSKAGAIGLMQLMPDTARQLGVDPTNPRQNLQGGIRYLKDLAKRYGELNKTLAAYNAGPGNVQKYGGVPPFPETRRYIQKIRMELFDKKR